MELVSATIGRSMRIFSFVPLCVIMVGFAASAHALQKAPSVCEAISQQLGSKAATTEDEITKIEQCAFTLTRLEKNPLSESYAHKLFFNSSAVSQVISTLTELYILKAENGFAKLEFARRYFDQSAPIDVQSTAKYWLNEILVSRSPCSVPASFELGKFVLDQTASVLLEAAEARSFLLIAALEKYPPAMATYGKVLIAENDDSSSLARGYGFLLAASKMGEVDADFISQIALNLTHNQVEEGRVQSNIILARPVSMPYSSCSG